MSDLTDQAYARLLEAAQDEVAATLFELRGTEFNPGDSPIEKLFSMALIIRVRFSINNYALALPLSNIREDGRRPYNEVCHDLVFVPQAQLPWGRVDFVVQRPIRGRDDMAMWRNLIVECDGHDFHERTKDQAARDRSRDREAQLAGFTIFRFTGAELWRDAWGCAGKVLEWAAKAE